MEFTKKVTVEDIVFKFTFAEAIELRNSLKEFQEEYLDYDFPSLYPILSMIYDTLNKEI